MTTSLGLTSVTQWILKKHPERTSIDSHEDLIAHRLIDSLSFVEFVFLIEQEAGVSIDIENIDLDQFRTLGAIEKSFFS